MLGIVILSRHFDIENITTADGLSLKRVIADDKTNMVS